MEFKKEDEIPEKRKLTTSEWYEHMKRMEEEYDSAGLSEREDSYRRGYSQGFYNGSKLNYDEENIRLVYQWRHNHADLTAPPFSAFAGMELHGLTKVDEHRFFINRLKPL
jgi:hypothetical protein